MRPHIIFMMDGVRIIGDITWNFDLLLATGTLKHPTLTLHGGTMRNAYVSSDSFPNTSAIIGNVTVNATDGSAGGDGRGRCWSCCTPA